jgi:hypothetical protein
MSGVKGPIDDVVKKYVSGAIHSAADVTAEGTPGHPEQDCRFSKTA